MIRLKRRSVWSVPSWRRDRSLVSSREESTCSPHETDERRSRRGEQSDRQQAKSVRSKLIGALASAVVLSAALLPSTAFAQGNMLDFSIGNLSGPSGSVAYYDPIPVSFTVQLQGAPFTGNVGYEISVVGPAGVPWVVLSGSAFLNNGPATVNVMPSLPPQITVGAMLAVMVRVDPMNVIAEASETNNLAMSPQTFVVIGAELVPSALSAPNRATRGTSITVDVTISNNATVEARNFVYQYTLGPAGGPSFGVFTSSTMTMAASSSLTLSDTFTVPAGVPLGNANLTVFVDSTSVVPENSEANNTARVGIDIVDPSPDFTITLADFPTMMEVGQQVDVSRTVSNLGDLTGTTDFELFLSTDAVITRQDIGVGSGNTMVLPGGANTGRVVVTVPPGTPAGMYYLGAIVDPANAVVEHDESNNTFVSNLISVFPGPLTIITSSLPSGDVGITYNAQLAAGGGSGSEQWVVMAGGLPPGLGLGPTGEIFGRPTAAGIYAFVVQVFDGMSSDSATLQIEIREPPGPITILTTALPTAILGRPYEVMLVASGGRPPLVYRVTGLPPGLTSRGALITGVPTTVGQFPVEAMVSDGVSSAVMQYVLEVRPGTSDLLLSVTELPAAVVGLDYCAGGVVRLSATGGAPPYEFAITEGEVPGLVLETDGSICGTPTTVGQFTFVVRVTDSAREIDTGRMAIEVTSTALRISTDNLVDGLIGAAYEASLETTGGTGAVSWSLASGTLPPGLVLGMDGSIRGTAAQLGTFPFAVAARDEAGAEHVAPLAIRVVQGSGLIETGAEGCSCTAQSRRGPGRGAVLLLFVLALRLRRPSRGRGTSWAGEAFDRTRRLAEGEW